MGFGKKNNYQRETEKIKGEGRVGEEGGGLGVGVLLGGGWFGVGLILFFLFIT